MNLKTQLNATVSIPYKFPKEAFEILYKHNLFQLPRFRNSKITEFNEADENQIILQDLIAIGYADLAVGRIYEGHINALLIIDRYGNDLQKKKYFKEAKEGKIFGIWNTEHPSEAMTYEDNKQLYRLNGAKTFCSGSLDVTRPIITAQTDEGKKMFILELENHPELEEDNTFWNVMGMGSTVSHRIDFTGIEVKKEQVIGETGDYDRQPMITTGAIRFAAVQFGCAKAIADIMLKYLKKTNRAEDIIQNTRIAEVGMLIKTGYLWFKAYKDVNLKDDEQHINYVNMVRTDILRICESVLNISEKAIGVQAFLKTNEFESKYRDLRVYLKQPNPDLAFANIGRYYTKMGYIDENILS